MAAAGVPHLGGVAGGVAALGGLRLRRSGVGAGVTRNTGARPPAGMHTATSG